MNEPNMNPAEPETDALVEYVRKCAAWFAGQEANENAKMLTRAADRIESLTRDTERLDWLDRTNAPFKMGWRIGCAPVGNVSVWSVIQLSGLTPIRAAIDAAIDAAMLTAQRGG